MKITYRSKSGLSGIAIQVNSVDGEDLSVLIKKLTDKGFTHKPLPYPVAFKQKVLKNFFYRNGSGLFGLKTTAEGNSFVNDSYLIIKKFDPTIKLETTEFDND